MRLLPSLVREHVWTKRLRSHLPISRDENVRIQWPVLSWSYLIFFELKIKLKFSVKNFEYDGPKTHPSLILGREGLRVRERQRENILLYTVRVLEIGLDLACYGGPLCYVGLDKDNPVERSTAFSSSISRIVGAELRLSAIAA